MRPAHAAGDGPLVLVVDDIEDNREIYAGALAHHGYRVETAVDGFDALRKIEERIPDLVLMDLSMPGLDGWETTRRIKSDERFRHVIVIALTGYVVGESLRRAERLGAAAVLTKPCTPDIVIDVIEQLLDR